MGKRAEAFLSLGFAAVDWIETYLVHGPGDVEGDAIALDDEFAAFIVRAYEVDQDGKRRKRRAVISRPKGRAKSELAAMIVCFEALGPARFSHFAKRGEVSPWGYRYAEGEPVGMPVRRPQIRCFATELGQSGNTFEAVAYMMHEDTCSKAFFRDFGKVDVGLTRINLPHGGEVTPETAKDTSKDGGKDTFDVFDETHLWVLPQLHRLHQTVLRNLLKRKVASGWALETTTMYAPGERSVAEGTHEYAKAVAEGRVADLGLLFDHRQAASKYDASKPKDRLAGLKDVYGPASAWMDLQSIADSYEDPQSTTAAWERYWFNRPMSLQGQWLPQRAWDECHAARQIADGATVVLSLDGSFNGDSTALVAVEVGAFPHVTVAGLWERSSTAEDWRVPILDVEDAIRTACLRWNVVEVTADPSRWARSLEVLEADGLPMSQFPQSAARMTPATQRFTDMVNQRQLTHDGSPALSRHVSNAVLKQDARGMRIYKETKTSAKKIDLAVAAIMGVERACWHATQPVSEDPFILF